MAREQILKILKHSKKLPPKLQKLLAEPEKKILKEKGAKAAFRALVRDRVGQPRMTADLAKLKGHPEVVEELLKRSEKAKKTIIKAGGAKELRMVLKRGGLLAGAVGAITDEAEAGKFPVKDIIRILGKKEIPNVNKPQGLYFTLGKISPHREIGSRELKAIVTGKNVLEVPQVRVEHSRFGEFKEGEVSAGISALKSLTSKEEFNRLTHLSKKELTKELTTKYPNVDWNRYYDSYEQLEGLAGLLARKKGYDSIILIDKIMPEFSEYIALDKKAFEPLKYMLTGGFLGGTAVGAKASDEDIENNLLEPIPIIQADRSDHETPHEVVRTPEQQVIAQKQEAYIDELLSTPPDKQAMKCHLAKLKPESSPWLKQRAMDYITFAHGGFKGVSGFLHYVPGYRSLIDHSEESINQFAGWLGVDVNKGAYSAGEFVGSMAPLSYAMSGAKWFLGAMRFRPDFLNRFIMTGAFGAAYEGLTGTFKDKKGKEVLAEIGKTGALYGSFEAISPIAKVAAKPFKALHKYMLNREKLYDKMVEKVLKQVEKIPGPRRFKLEKAGMEYGESWREWIESPRERLPKYARKLFFQADRNLGIAQNDAEQLFHRMIMSNKNHKHLDKAQRMLLTRYYKHGWRTHKRPLGKPGERALGEFLEERAKAAKIDLPLEKLSEPEKKLIRTYARDIRRTMFKYEKMGTEIGWKKVGDELKPLLNVHTFQRTVGSYLPDYREFIGKNNPELLHLLNYIVKSPLTNKDLVGKIETARMTMSRFMKQKGMPAKLRHAFEEILDAGELSYRAILDVSHDVELGRLFQTFYNDPKMSMSTRAFDALVKEGKLNIQNWIQLTTDKHAKYGMLAGRVINRDLYRELQNYVDPILHTDTLLRKAMSHWKSFKVVYRSSTQVRNNITNVILNHLNGMSIFDPRAYYYSLKSAKAIMKGRGKTFNEFLNSGVLTGTYRQAELPALRAIRLDESLGLFDFLGRAGRKFSRRMHRIYEGSEFIAKGAKYLYNKNIKKMADFAAADDAVKSTFNYNDIPRALKRFRAAPWGAPFITFTYKALPMLAKTTVNHPWRVGSLLALMKAVQWHNVKELGITDKEWKQIEKKLPDHVKTGSYLPWFERDKYGRIQFRDMTFIVPWGELLQIRSDVRERGPFGVGVGSIIFSNPLYATMYEWMHNQDYSGRKIYNEWDDSPTKAFKTLQHFWKAAVPSILVGGYDYNLVRDALEQEKEPPLGLPTAPTLKQALEAQVGLRTYARTEEQIIQQDVKKRQFIQSDIMKELKKEIKKKPARAKRYTERAMKRMEELWSEED